MRILPFIVLAACSSADTDTDDALAPDVSERLAPGEVRAGIVADESALFGGISSEGRVGDLKIYNDRVQFIIQGDRVGQYWVREPGMVVDADIVRPEGHLGRDIVDEWVPMFGVGRIPSAESIEVVEDGSDGRAVVRVTGGEAVMDYITGALEAPDLVADLGLRITTDFVLDPDAWLMEVVTTVEAADEVATFSPGDLLFGAREVADVWEPGGGFSAEPAEDKAWTAYVGRESDLAVGVFTEEPLDAGGLGLLADFFSVGMAMGGPVTLQPGESLTWHRWYGVGPDLAALTDAWLAATGQPTDTVTDTVTAPDGPVAGARVAVTVDGRPFTMAFTGADGSFTANVPASADVDLLADGRGTGRWTDLPEGRTWDSAYASPGVRAATLEGLAVGAPGPAWARGRGSGTADAPLTLLEPATLTVRTHDGLPFEVQASRDEPDPPADPHLVMPRPDGRDAWAWATDGEVTLQVEPGTWNLLVHRGPVYELAEVDGLVLAAGANESVEVELPQAFSHPDWLLMDPHMHASPSPDGRISMEDRLIVAAARGLQVHFGTDHDHVADYRPALKPLGLDPVLNSVVSDEVSPVIRGHLNVYPLDPDPDLPNNGTFRWYSDIVDTTEAELENLRARWGGDDIIVQVNHPTTPGVASAAGWVDGGTIGQPSGWTTDFQALEVMNGGSIHDYMTFYLDLVNHNVVVTPVGVSDDHGYSGGVGLTSTWAHMGTDKAPEYTDAALLNAWRARTTVPSRGPFVLTDPLPGSEVVGSTTLDVEVRSASWVHVDRIELLRDGEVVETVEGTTATFTLAPDQDASYVVIASGDQGMLPVTSWTPWAMTSAILVDVDGDGWEAPSGALTLVE